MEFLAPADLRARAADLRRTLDELLANRALVSRPKARQWRFLAACVERLLTPGRKTPFDSLSPVVGAQLKFEAQDRLRRLYQRRERSDGLVFWLAHQRDLAAYGIADVDRYPNIRGYCLLVRDASADLPERAGKADLSAYLERVVTQAIDAEFEAYVALPEVLTRPLERWFHTEGPAFREIASLLSRQRELGRTLSGPLNPSTKRLLGARTRAITSNEAVVGTTEYWYLRWWDSVKKNYVHAYRETNRQTYGLRRTPDGNWKVFENLRPSPRASLLPSRRTRSARQRISGPNSNR